MRGRGSIRPVFANPFFMTQAFPCLMLAKTCITPFFYQHEVRRGRPRLPLPPEMVELSPVHVADGGQARLVPPLSPFVSCSKIEPDISGEFMTIKRVIQDLSNILLDEIKLLQRKPFAFLYFYEIKNQVAQTE